MTGGTHLSYVFKACLQRAFMLAFMAKETPVSSNRRVMAIKDPRLPLLLNPCPPSSVSPPRPHPSRPQATGISCRSPLLRRRRRPFPASTSNPAPSTLPYHLCHVLALLLDFSGFFCCSRTPPQPAPELRRRRTLSGEQLLLAYDEPDDRDPAIPSTSTLRSPG